jgi:hypothetical protein
MAFQNQLPKPMFPELSSGHQLFLSQLVDTVNSLQGFNGVIKLNNHIDMGGSRVTNIGDPETATDALASGIAESSYSATALRPKLESGGSTPLKSVRRVNDPNQREQVSSWLNDLMSTPPNANTIFPLISNVMGGVSVTIPATLFTFADGTTVMLTSRTDLLSLPGDFAISSISVTGGIVTIITATTTSLAAGQSMTVAGVSPSGFNGTVTVIFANPGTNELQYQDFSVSGSGTGGTVELNGVYYYSARRRSTIVSLLGPFASDTADNRLQVCQDGFQIVAVVLLTASGAQIESSGGGGSPITGIPTAGAFF